MRTVVVRHLTPEQAEPWEFRLSPDGSGGGNVAVPAAMHGQPVDWPPKCGAQADWLEQLVPGCEPRGGAGWYLKPKLWKRLVETLDAQALEETP